jgi:NTE family protein
MTMDATTPNRKRIKLALQGGGAHGAFTWGVMDRLFEDGRLEVEGIVGTSAGAMNATVAAYGLVLGGPEMARRKLREFWHGASEEGRKGPLQPSWFDRMLSVGNMDFSPTWLFMDALSKVMSPYDLNPMNLNPLRDLLVRVVDFDRLHAAGDFVRLFICATNVLNGRLRVFDREHVTPDAVLASACLPFMFQAVEIDGQAYWDGGYCGNPPIFPLIYMGGTPDILIVQINPINIREVPKSAPAIMDRINTLSFNSSLMREMRMVKFVSDLIDQGELKGDRYSRMFIHTIEAERELGGFSVSSKLNPSMDFLNHLFALGQAKADAFLDAHFDAIGVRDSTDLEATFF